jgi:hypothetical protein
MALMIVRQPFFVVNELREARKAAVFSGLAGPAVSQRAVLILRPFVLLAAFVAATLALALDMPTRKAGLWELKMNFEGRNIPPQTMKHCIDAATDKLMNMNFGGSNEQIAPSRT